MDTNAYLERIHYRGSVAPTEEILRQLQLAHLLAVPFENLSIHLKEPIVLTNEALFEKVVSRRRGGFCYELNGLFAALLRALGFKVEMLSGGVMSNKGAFGPEFDHMALLVRLEKRWLVDVGFGDSFREPLLLDERAEQVQGSRAYRIDVAASNRFVLMQRNESGEWRSQYRFSLEPHIYADYTEMCRYHQTSPESPFTQRRLCSRATENGRVTISEMRLIETSDGKRVEHALAGEHEFSEALEKYFGIVLPSAVAAETSPAGVP